MNKIILRTIYASCAILVGASVPLVETLKLREVESEQMMAEIDEAVKGVKISVVEDTLPESDTIEVVATPKPLSVPGGEFVVAASAAIVVDDQTNHALFSKSADQVRPIASITKLATALTFLNHKIDWNTIITMERSDEPPQGGSTYVYRGEEITVRDLWFLSLVRSDNNATRALARSTGLGQEDFIAEMNNLVRSFGMRNTRFSEPTGLSSENVSTPRELVVLMKYAMENKLVSTTLQTREYTLETARGKRRYFKNTNHLLLDSSIAVLGGKTGYTERAGYCFVSAIEGPDNQRLYIAVLGSNSYENRFNDTKELANWTWNHWEWPKTQEEESTGRIGG